MNGSTPVTSVTAVSGGVTQGVYTIDANKNVVFTPEPGFVGTATPVTYQITDSLSRPVTTTYTPTVIGPPNAVDDATSGPFNTAQSEPVLSDDTASSGATLVANSLTLMSGGSPVTSVTAYAANGTTVQGVYTLGANNKIVFTPEPGFVGTATAVTYRVTDSLGQTDTATYTPTINPPTPPGVEKDRSEGPFNTPQVMPVLTNDVDLPVGVTWNRNTLTLMSGGSPVTSVTAYASNGTTVQGVYTIDADKNVVFTPEPGFVGTATPVTYQITDSLGRSVTTTYTPTIVPPTPIVFEVNIPTLSHTGMGPIGGTVMLIATLLGTGAFAVVASRRARKNAA
jgi:CshA-type fibril repeat protein